MLMTDCMVVISSKLFRGRRLRASSQLAIPTDALVQIEGETVVFRRNATGALEPVPYAPVKSSAIAP